MHPRTNYYGHLNTRAFSVSKSILLFDEVIWVREEMWRMKLGSHEEQMLKWNFWPFSKTAAIRRAHQGPRQAGEALPGGLPRHKEALVATLAFTAWLVTGDARIQRDRFWHLAVGRRGNRCQFHALWRRIWKARNDPVNEGETWASPWVLNLLSASWQSAACCPSLGWKQMWFMLMPRLGFLLPLNITQRFPFGSSSLFIRALQTD